MAVMDAIIWMLLVSGVSMAFLGLYGRRFVHRVPAARPYTLLMFSAGAWAILYALELLSASLQLKVLFHNLRFLILPFFPFLELWLVIAYVKKTGWLRRDWAAASLIIPVAAAILAMTSQFHTLFRYQFSMDTSGPVPVLTYSEGPFYTLYFYYTLALLVLAIIILIGETRKQGTLRERQTMLLLPALAIPTVINYLFTANITPVPGVNPTPVLLWIPAILYTIAIFRYGFLDIIPVARSRVIENMSTPMLVLDTGGRVVDLNPAARSLFPGVTGAITGMDAGELAKDWPELLSLCRARESGRRDLVRADDAGARYYTGSADLLSTPAGETEGLLVLLQEVTEQKATEEALREKETRLRAVIEGSPIPQFVLGSDHRIIYWNRALEELTGIPASEVIGTNRQWTAFYPAERPVMADLVMDGNSREILALYEGKFSASKFIDGAYGATDFFPKLGDQGMWLSFTAAPIRGPRGTIIGAVETLEEITEHRRADEEIRRLGASVQEEKDRLKILLDSIPDEVWFADRENRVTLVNQAVLREFGPETFADPNVEKIASSSEVYRPDGSPRPVEEAPPIRALAGEVVKDQGEIVRVPTSGELRYRQVNAAPVRDAEGNIIGSVSVVRDITDRKKAEEERERLLQVAQASERLAAADLEVMKRLQELGSLFLVEGNLEPVLTEIVDAAVAISGADFGNIQLLDPESGTLKIVAHRGFPQWWLDYWDRVSEGKGSCGTALGRRERVIVEDVTESPIFKGEALDVQRRAGVRAVQSTPLVSRSGKPLGMFSTHYRAPHRPDDRALRLLDLLAREAADMIERHQAEQALRESEERYRALVDSAPVAILVHHHGRVLYANQNAIDLYGAPSIEELKTRDIMQLVPPEEQVIATDRVKGIEDGRPLPAREGTILRLDGTRVPIEMVSSPVHYEGVMAAQAVMWDITERKRAEERIAHLASFPEQNPNPILEMNSEGEIIYANPAASRILAELGMRGDPAGFLPGDFTTVVPRLLEGDVDEEVKIGKQTLLETLSLNPLTRTTRVYARDITGRKKAEEALRASEEQFRRAIEEAPIPIIMHAEDGKVLQVSRTWTELTGFSAADIPTFEAWLNRAYGEGANEVRDHMHELFTGTARSIGIEFPVRTHDGRTRHWSFSASAPGALADGHRFIVGMAVDITERKEAEEALRQTSEYLENLINHANAPIIVWDPEFRITRFNQAFERLTGRAAADVLGKPLEILFPPEHAEVSMDLIRKTMGGERWESVEIPILHLDGSVRTVLWNSAPLYEADGRTVSSAIAQGQDITDRKRLVEEIARNAAEVLRANEDLKVEIAHRKQAEEAVRNALSTLNAAMESTADGMLVLDRAGRVTSYNRNFTTMFNVPEAMLITLDTRAAIDYVAVQTRDPDAFQARIQEISNHPSRESYDMLELLDGRIVERYSKPQRIGNSIVGRVYSFRDITEQKRAEFQLIESLNEKEVLLREIHHRVKNNLQLTTSLLDMTRMRTEDPATGGILTDVMMKIQTMAQIHTRLYESKQFDRINMNGQIRDQIRALSGIYSGGNREIGVEIDSPDLFLPIDQAIPCALALNEILSNAYKHAFKGRKSGTVKYSAAEEDGLIRFNISDDGIGFPKGFDISRANTLGLKLVRTLVEKQLKGTLVMKKRRKGTEVTVEIPRAEEKAHV